MKVGVIENKNLFPNVNIIFDTREDSEDRQAWLNQRCNSIGGSEIGAIAGFSDYGTALTVYNEKLGLVDKFKGNIHTQFGNRMEPIIREWFQDDFEKATNIHVDVYEYPFMMTSKMFPYFSANIDGFAMLGEDYKYYENLDTGEFRSISRGEPIGIEIKTASEFLKKIWVDDEIPDAYYCQCQWYMGVTGLNYFIIVYLLGKEVKWKVIPRNEEDIQMLFKKGEEFWENNILKKIPPEPTGNKKETEQILEQQSLQDGVIGIDDGLLEDYLILSEGIKELEEEKERVKQNIFLSMENMKRGEGSDYKISRWNVKKDAPDLKKLKESYPQTYEAILKEPTEFVSLKVSKIK